MKSTESVDFKNLDFLNDRYQLIKTNGKIFNNGSITPRTTSKKLVLDEVKITEEAKEKYNKYSFNSINNIKEKIEKIITEEKKAIDLYSQLSKLESYKKEEGKIKEIEEKIKLSSNKFELLKNAENKIIEFLDDFGFETIYQKEIKNVELEDVQFLTDKTPVVLRYGLDTKSKALESIIDSVIEKGALHPYEAVLFDKAFKYLSMAESAENYLKDNKIFEKIEKTELLQIENKKSYPNNVVLVDIFDRSTGFINEGNNQTHTIALWKKKDDELVLIDPSQKSYSDHLLDLVRTLSAEKINTLDCKMLYGVATYKGNEITGYSNYEEPKPKPRDCVDIAIKICFELNEQQKLSNLDKITDNMLQQISNEAKNAPHLTKLSSIVIRELQSSDFSIRTNAKRVINIVNECIQKQQIQGLRVDKIKNYQDISKAELAISTIKEFC